MLPYLNGPPGVIFLMFVMAMAAYLRQVSATARDKIELIEADKESLWPCGDDHTTKRLEILQRTRYVIKVVTIIYFVIAFFVGLRLCLWIISPILPHFGRGLFGLSDLVLVSVVIVSVAIMGFLHWYSRKRDDAVFEQMLRQAPILRDWLC